MVETSVPKVLSQSQQDVDIYVRQHHFVVTCVGKTHDERCLCIKNKHGDDDIHRPSQTAHQEF
jgi:hypothetical protein